MLLLWCHWFKYRFIKIDLVTAGKFCFTFRRSLGGVVDCVNVNPNARTLNKGGEIRDKKPLDLSRNIISLQVLVDVSRFHLT